MAEKHIEKIDFRESERVAYLLCANDIKYDLYKVGEYSYSIVLNKKYEIQESIKQTNKNVRRTNNKTWVIAGLAALFAGLTFFRDYRQDRQWQHKLLELKEQLQDSSQQIRESFQSDVHRLEDSLKKILNEPKVETPKTPAKPKPTGKP